MSSVGSPIPEATGRFAALARLGKSGRAKKIPYVQQLAATDCGAACLTMVLGYFGKSVRLDEVRDASGVGRDGTTAQAILAAARWFGLRGRGVRLEVEDLELLDPGMILHWDFSHFVVFEAIRDDGVDIVDPAFGQRRVPMQEFRKSFTGVALLLEPGETFEPEASRERPLATFIGQLLGRSGLWARIGVTSLLLQAFALALPVLTGVLVDRVVPRSDYHLLAIVLVGAAGVVGFFLLSSLVRAHLLLHLRTHLDARMTLNFLDHLLALPYAFFQRRSSGDLMMRLSSNAVVREILTAGVLSGLLDGTLVCLYLLVLFVASPAMALLVLVLALLQVLVFLFTRSRQRALMSQSLQVQARSQSYQVEMLAGIETLKSMGTEQTAAEHWSNLFVDELNVALRRGALDATIDSILSMLKMASPLAILAYGGIAVLRGDLTLGSMLALSALGSGFLSPLGSLVATAGRFQLLGSYLERINDVMQTPPEQELARTPHTPRLRGGITLEHISFRYSAVTPMVVKEISVSIDAGQFVALVGRSGSGKSTLASLILGLYPPTAGRILYDNVDLHEMELRALRQQLGIVTQRPYLFGGTVRANIALGAPETPLDEIVRAAKLAHVDEDIQAMPMGYDTVLLDAGASLSGGQRQRIALARALLRSPAILLLDEATSALDAVTESLVQRELVALGCTRIVIAHRLSTIFHADVILVLEDGVLVERGTHAELLARGGAYARLVEAQLGQIREDG